MRIVAFRRADKIILQAADGVVTNTGSSLLCKCSIEFMDSMHMRYHNDPSSFNLYLKHIVSVIQIEFSILYAEEELFLVDLFSKQIECKVFEFDPTGILIGSLTFDYVVNAGIE